MFDGVVMSGGAAGLGPVVGSGSATRSGSATTSGVDGRRASGDDGGDDGDGGSVTCGGVSSGRSDVRSVNRVLSIRRREWVPTGPYLP